MPTRRLAILVGLALTVSLIAPAAGLAAEQPAAGDPRVLQRYAADTWRSFELLLEPATGLPADNVSESGERSRYTSPTNVGAYLWSTLAARDLGVITPAEAHRRIATTLGTLAGLERHQPSGMFYNWYDPVSGAKLTTWPVGGSPVYPFLSSVDNGWMAAGLVMVANAVPQLRRRASALLEPMDFGYYHDPAAGLLRGGFWVDPPAPGTCTIAGNYRGGADVRYTCHHYGSLNTEPRIASYLGIAFGQVPASHYFKMWRTFPPTCDWGWQEQQPAGVTRTYLGVEVFEGHYRYRGMDIVPSWGGSMFEALMVPLLVPEARWGPRSWGVNHPLYVKAQIEHGLHEARHGYWGFSPSNNPSGGYREYGVDAIGLNPDGYASNNDNTLVDYGFGDCRPAQPVPPPEAYTNGVVTPHASFLALPYARGPALANLANLRRDFDAYGEGGFFDAVNVDTGQVSRHWLALDQGMVMAALANELTGDLLQRYFTRGEVERAVRPLLAIEEFTAGR